MANNTDIEGSKLLDVASTKFTVRQNECVAAEQTILALGMLEDQPWTKGQSRMEEFVTAVQDITQLQTNIRVPDTDNLQIYAEEVILVGGMPQGHVENDLSLQVEAMQVEGGMEQTTETMNNTHTDVQHTIANWRDYISKVFLRVYFQGVGNGVVLWGEHVIPGERDGWSDQIEAMTSRKRGEAAGKLMEFLYGQCSPPYSVTARAVPKELKERAATQTRQVSFTLTMQQNDVSKWLQQVQARVLNTRTQEMQKRQHMHNKEVN